MLIKKTMDEAEIWRGLSCKVCFVILSKFFAFERRHLRLVYADILHPRVTQVERALANTGVDVTVFICSLTQHVLFPVFSAERKIMVYYEVTYSCNLFTKNVFFKVFQQEFLSIKMFFCFFYFLSDHSVICDGKDNDNCVEHYQQGYRS